MSIDKLVLASHNSNKLIEFRRMLYPTIPNLPSVNTFSLEEPEESGLTYSANAKIKVLHCTQTSGLASLADDSGIEINALYGGPGVGSARFGATQEERIQKVLNHTKSYEISHSLRKAIQKCVLAFLDPAENLIHYFNGEIHGVICDSPKGTNGFGYDSIFFIPSLGKTLAELNDEDKDTVSHRGQAVSKFLNFLKEREKSCTQNF